MFAKVYTTILDSSLAEDWQVRHVFEDMLKLCDADGLLDMTHESFARRTNVPIEIVRRAIDELEKPDPRSRTPDFNGIRIVRIDEHRDWGWHIVNYAKFRAMASDETRKEHVRKRVASWRAKNSDSCNAPTVTQALHSVTDRYPSASASASVSQEGECKGGEDPNSYEQRFPTEPEASGETSMYHLHARIALHYLNEKTNRNYRETADNLGVISDRLREDGVTIEGVKQMIDRQIAQWRSTRFKDFLRPVTLFGTKFDNYYATRNEPTTSHLGNSSAGNSRTRGTFNDGQATKYKLSAIQKNRELPTAQQS